MKNAEVRPGPGPAGPTARDALLCVANFPANTGYAWDFIEGTFAQLAVRLAGHGIRVLVGYPAIFERPRALIDSPATPVVLPAPGATVAFLRALRRHVRTDGVRVLYLIDQDIVSAANLLYRAIGVKALVFHEHSSGERRAPRGPRAALKYLVARTPGVMPDRVLTVSDFVRAQVLQGGIVPAEPVRRIWNGLPTAPPPPDPASSLHALLPRDRPVVVCAARANEEKGVHVLLRAFRALLDNWAPSAQRPFLAYAGAGPFLGALASLRSELGLEGDSVLLGYRPDVPTLYELAAVVVVPSLWPEAFGLSVLEPMRQARPIIASDVGAVSELVRHRQEALLVAPADVPALAHALRELLSDRRLADALAGAALQRMQSQFSDHTMIQHLEMAILEAFDA